MTSTTHPDFWKCYEKLPLEVKNLADRKFSLFRCQPFHSSLGFSKKGVVWTVDIGLHYRAIALARTRYTCVVLDRLTRGLQHSHESFPVGLKLSL
uniref:Uncharacterized protein n=1 Tax=uncultured Desulfobacterium sp. TaxID=201089 RepID=E1YJU4_9BACT|nr:hypothetical protein N47_E50600 [uncultured Desulfobacterium sp.]